MFPDIVAYVRSTDVLSSSSTSSSQDGLIQLVNSYQISCMHLCYLHFDRNQSPNLRCWDLIDSVKYLQMDVELWVQSPRLPPRNVKFLRFSKMIAERKWAVVDVSVDGNNGDEKEISGTSYAGYRLLPSGCLIENLSGGFCKVLYHNSIKRLDHRRMCGIK